MWGGVDACGNYCVLSGQNYMPPYITILALNIYTCQDSRPVRYCSVCVGLGGVYCTYPVPLHAHTHFLSSVRAAFVLHRVRGQALTAPLLLSHFRVSQHLRHTLLMCRVQTLQERQRDNTKLPTTLTYNLSAHLQKFIVTLYSRKTYMVVYGGCHCQYKSMQFEHS